MPDVIGRSKILSKIVAPKQASKQPGLLPFDGLVWPGESKRFSAFGQMFFASVCPHIYHISGRRICACVFCGYTSSIVHSHLLLASSFDIIKCIHGDDQEKMEEGIKGRSKDI